MRRPRRSRSTSSSARTFAGYDADGSGGVLLGCDDPAVPDRGRPAGGDRKLVARHDPGFGYATFAQLLEHQPCGPRCNLVFTTNFDDLVADALYLYTRTRPLVVSHASLADFVTSGRTRPTIVKLHGDAMLAPLNDATQLAELHAGHGGSSATTSATAHSSSSATGGTTRVSPTR